MSGFHGCYSVGGIVGATGVSTALSHGASPAATTAVVAGLLAATVVGVAAHLLTEARVEDRLALLRAARRRAADRRARLRGVPARRGGARLERRLPVDVRGVAVTRAGAGYIAFSVTMTIGRLIGDRIVGRFGDRRVLAAGALVAAAGIALVALVPSWPMALAGFALVGAGASNIVPVLFSAAGRQTAMPESVAVPAMTTFSYAGLLAGPAAIGFVAGATGLSIAFLLLAAMMTAVAVAGRRLTV